MDTLTHARAWAAAVAISGAAGMGCSVPDLDLTGRSCPCASGYTCDTAMQVCVPGGSGRDGSVGPGPDGGVGRPDGGSGDGPRVGDATVDGVVPEAGGTCPGSLAWCGGLCVALDTDTHNCAACGRDCLGTQCIASQCQPIVLLPDAGQVVSVALDADNVYWASLRGVVAKVPKAGGAPTVIDSSTDYNNALILGGGSLYWTRTTANPITGGVLTCPTGGCAGAPTVLGSTPTSPMGLTLAAGEVFWVDNGELTNGFMGWIRANPAAGGPTATVASSQVDPSDMASDGTNVYWVNRGPLNTPDGSVMACPLAGCGSGPTMLVGAVPWPYLLVADPTSLYFASADMASGNVALLSCALTGCASPTVVVPSTGVNGIALDASFVYWTAAAAIMKVPLGGGAPITLATYAQVNSSFTAIAVDDTAVYWGTYQALLKVAK